MKICNESSFQKGERHGCCCCTTHIQNSSLGFLSLSVPSSLPSPHRVMHERRCRYLEPEIASLNSPDWNKFTFITFSLAVLIGNERRETSFIPGNTCNQLWRLMIEAPDAALTGWEGAALRCDQLSRLLVGKQHHTVPPVCRRKWRQTKIGSILDISGNILALAGHSVLWIGNCSTWVEGGDKTEWQGDTEIMILVFIRWAWTDEQQAREGKE